jgi:V8-like Glu-specific endopeptidase
MIKKTFCISSLAVLALSACGFSDTTGNESTEQAAQDIVRGTATAGRPYVVQLRFERYSGRTSTCSGTLFAPRVVLTAGHCLPSDAIPGRVFAYSGADLATDLPLRYNIPAPGQPSAWAKADSWEAHPSYSAQTQDADIAVVYLDRQPMAVDPNTHQLKTVDPLPLNRTNVGASFLNTKGTLVGWGASLALSADIQTNTGGGVKRTGTATILGTPTLADYHADDPNAGMLSATIRSHYIKLDGHAPNANTCAGDSGGPMILNISGQDRIAGVSKWTGLWCEDYSLFTRIDPYLPFLDNAYLKGGQATVIPYVECVYKPATGKQTAYFGYKNNNGVSVNVPYDANKNALALDVQNKRPSLFNPGDQHYQFGIDFTPGQTVTWKLSPTNSPTTILNATSNSPTCVDNNQFKCLRSCQATAASACSAELGVSFEYCMEECSFLYDYFAPISCDTQWSAYLQCSGATPSAASNWDCTGAVYDEPVAAACSAQFSAAMTCAGF